MRNSTASITGESKNPSRSSDECDRRTLHDGAEGHQPPNKALGSEPATYPLTMRMLILLFLLLPSPLLGQAPAPRFLYVYRDSLKQGVDSIYRVIENDGAQICADLRCPNPYIGLESLTGPHEAWWLNTFATEADTIRVAKAYASDRALATALARIAQRKAALIGAPVQGFAVYRRDLSQGRKWSVAGARFIEVTVTRDPRPVKGSVWMMADSTLYILRPIRALREARALAGATRTRVFAIRPNWSMPAPAWVATDPTFWRSAPVAKSSH
jgi:hypothetical protein